MLSVESRLYDLEEGRLLLLLLYTTIMGCGCSSHHRFQVASASLKLGSKQMTQRLKLPLNCIQWTNLYILKEE
jgi:hypothetical protein